MTIINDGMSRFSALSGRFFFITCPKFLHRLADTPRDFNLDGWEIMANKEAPPETPSHVKFETGDTDSDHELWTVERAYQATSLLRSATAETRPKTLEQLSYEPRPATTDLAQHDLVDHRVVEMSEPSNNVHPHTSSEKSDGSAYLVEVAGAQSIQEEFAWCPPGQKVIFRLIQAELELFQVIAKGRYAVRKLLGGKKNSEIHYISHMLLRYAQQVLRLTKKSSLTIQYHLVDNGNGAAHLEVLGMASIGYMGGEADLTEFNNGVHYIFSCVTPPEPAAAGDVSLSGQQLEDASRLLADQAICKILDQFSGTLVSEPFIIHAGGEVINCGSRYAQKRPSAPVPLRDRVEHIGYILNIRTGDQAIDIQLKNCKSLIPINYNPDEYLEKLRVWAGETTLSRFTCSEQAGENVKHPLLSLKYFKGGDGADPDLFQSDC